MPYGRGGAGNIEASQWDAAAYAATFKQKLADDLEAQKNGPSIPPQAPAASGNSMLAPGRTPSLPSPSPSGAPSGAPSGGPSGSPSPSGFTSGGEAQKTAITPSSAQQDYAHTGRGGAGNWYSPKTLLSTGTFTSSEDTNPLTTSPSPSTFSTDAPARPPQREQNTGTQHRGRGGAGNFVYAEEQLRNQHVNDKAENEKEIELQNLVKGDVEIGLKRPGKAYMGGRQEETDQGMNAEALRTLWS